MKNGQLVLVEWEDSNVIHGWRLKEGSSEDDTAHCRTVGIVKEEDATKITIAFGDSDCGGIMETITIPKCSITSIQPLRKR